MIYTNYIVKKRMKSVSKIVACQYEVITIEIRQTTKYEKTSYVQQRPEQMRSQTSNSGRSFRQPPAVDQIFFLIKSKIKDQISTSIYADQKSNLIKLVTSYEDLWSSMLRISSHQKKSSSEKEQQQGQKVPNRQQKKNSQTPQKVQKINSKKEINNSSQKRNRITQEQKNWIITQFKVYVKSHQKFVFSDFFIDEIQKRTPISNIHCRHLIMKHFGVEKLSLEQVQKIKTKIDNEKASQRNLKLKLRKARSEKKSLCKLSEISEMCEEEEESFVNQLNPAQYESQTAIDSFKND